MNNDLDRSRLGEAIVREVMEGLQFPYGGEFQAMPLARRLAIVSEVESHLHVTFPEDLLDAIQSWHDLSWWAGRHVKEANI